VHRVRIRPLFAAPVLAVSVAAVTTFIGADAGLAVAQPGPAHRAAPSLEVVTATAPGASPRLVTLERAPSPRPLRPVVRRAPADASPRAIGRRLAADRGWTGRQWSCLNKLWTRESDWHVHDRNGSSGAYGIPQALPGHKMSSAGHDWRDSATTQIRWGLAYIASSYGSPCGAWRHSQNYGYY
jgi:hypothetical protein